MCGEVMSERPVRAPAAREEVPGESARRARFSRASDIASPKLRAFCSTSSRAAISIHDPFDGDDRCLASRWPSDLHILRGRFDVSERLVCG